MINLNATLKNNFSSLLGSRRLKISAVSRDTGISRTTLTKLYYGSGEGIYYDVLEKLCNYLECDVGDFFSMEEQL